MMVISRHFYRKFLNVKSQVVERGNFLKKYIFYVYIKIYITYHLIKHSPIHTLDALRTIAMVLPEVETN